jgi:hypothetical protein
MSTPFEDGAGFTVGGEFTRVQTRGTRLVLADIPALNPTDPLINSFPAGAGSFTILPMQVGALSPLSTLPFWVVTPSVTNGDSILIPEAGAYAFSWKAAVRCSAGVGNVPYEISLMPDVIPGQVTPPAVSIWVDTLAVGDQYFPVSYVEAVIPGGHRWTLMMNVVQPAPATIIVLTQSREFSIRQVE